MEFIGFGKIPRLSKECVITEKIDGTNACVVIKEVPEDHDSDISVGQITTAFNHTTQKRYFLFAQSRTRFIYPGDDNAGFAAWVAVNAEDLVKLGEGHHFGEWWGQKIGRKYGLEHKRFSLFDTSRWIEGENTPDCCYVVPVLYHGNFSTEEINFQMDLLKRHGSIAAPGFMNPEGVIIYHTAAKQYFKKTFESLSKWELELKGEM